VSTFSLMPAVYPAAAPDALRIPLAEAAARGGSTLFLTGLDPGWASCQVAVAGLSVMHEVTLVRCLEVADWSHYGVEWVMRDVMGFGHPDGFKPPFLTEGIAASLWRGQLEQMVGLLGCQLDDIRTVVETCPTEVELPVSFGTIEVGGIGAIRFEIQVLVSGQPLVVIEHVNRIGRDVAPQWAQPAESSRAAFRLTIEGTPGMTISIDFDDHCEEPTVVATAMHAVNAIPSVVSAPPGLAGFADLPPYTSRNVALLRARP